MISRYQGNIGCCGRFDCRKEGGKNIHRTKGNVMKSVRLGHALQEEGDTIYVSLWEERPLPGIQPSFLFVSVHLITAIPLPLVPSPFSLKCGLRQDPGGERREKKGGRVERMNGGDERNGWVVCPLKNAIGQFAWTKKPSLFPFLFHFSKTKQFQGDSFKKTVVEFKLYLVHTWLEFIFQRRFLSWEEVQFERKRKRERECIV